MTQVAASADSSHILKQPPVIRVSSPLIRSSLSPQTMSFFKRILNCFLRFLGYYLSNSIYKKACHSHLIDSLQRKIIKDLTFASLDNASLSKQERRYVGTQAAKIKQIFAKAHQKETQDASYKRLHTLFEENPILTLAFIRILEKQDLGYFKNISDLVLTLKHSMDWKTGQGPYIEAVNELKQSLQGLGSLDKHIYDSSLSCLDYSASKHSLDLLQQMTKEKGVSLPITDVNFVSWEFKHVYEIGGLSEAVFSMAESLKTQRSDLPVKVLLPYFPHLMKPALQREIGPAEQFAINSSTSINIRKLNKNGLEFTFIEDPSFEVIKKLYGQPSNQGATVETMIKFSSLASSYLLKTCSATSVVHLHDWHVSRIAALMKESSIELKKEEKPTVVFTFHNNNIPCQGRFTAQDANPYQAAFTSSDLQYGLHLQKQAIACADIISTVSPTYAKECLLPALGHGLESILKQAHKAGRFFGILNGIHASSWDPFSNRILKSWTSLETSTPLDLSFQEGENYLEKKKLALKELNLWLALHFDASKCFDLTKPLFVYTGRYDYNQKGLEHLPQIVDEVEKQGGNVLFLGSSADSSAKTLLKKLTKKYASNPRMVFIEDEMEQGSYKYQESRPGRPGIKELTRMAASVMLMTSNFEPCGLVQMESFKFGSLVIAKKTGGLSDTVIPFEASKTAPNGYFLGDMPLKELVADAIAKAQTPEVIASIIKNSSSYNWDFKPQIGPSKIDAYERLYQLGHSFKFNTTSKKTHIKLNQAWLIDNGFHEIDPDRTLLHKTLGARSVEGGTQFTLHAPHAKKVSIQFFDKHGQIVKEHSMFKSTVNDTWIFNHSKHETLFYRYIIDGKAKIDPFASGFKYLDRQGLLPVCVHHTNQANDFEWTDQQFIVERRANTSTNGNIFEMHLASFAKDHSANTYQDMAAAIIRLSKETGFKKVELMGLSEHPYERSLGYQVTGFFAPNHRYGTPKDFKQFVNMLHEEGIEVVVDFVFNHFASDAWALENFDGTQLFEKSNSYDIRQWYGWGKYFDFEKPYTQSFLFSAVRNWIETYHIDGFRIDAIKPALRELGSPGQHFLRSLNAFIHKHFPGIKTYAEDYRLTKQATQKIPFGGLGFDSKWNLGMTHHTLAYLEQTAHGKKHLENLVKANEDLEVFCLSHDHVNEALGFIDTRTQVLAKERLRHKINQAMLLVQLLPGEKLVYHDQAALDAFRRIQNLKSNNALLRQLIDSSSTSGISIQPTAEPNLFVITITQANEETAGKKFTIVFNTSETPLRLNGSLSSKTLVASSYDLANQTSDQCTLAPYETKILSEDIV